MTFAAINKELDELWSRALDDYKKETNLDAPKLTQTHISNPDDLEELIDANLAAFKNFRSERKNIYHLIQNFMKPIARIATVVGDLSNVSGVGAALGTSMRILTHLISVGEEVTKSYDFIETVLTELQRYLDRISVYLTLPMTDPLRRKIVQILVFVIRVIGRSEKLIKQRRWRKYGKVAFLGQDNETKDLVDELNRALQNEQGLVVALTYAKVSETSELTATIIDQNTQVLEHVLDQQQIKNIEYAFWTLAIKATDDKLEENKEKLLEGSGSWLQKERLFEAWIHQQALILWVLGDPGSGKTMLSTWLIKTLYSMMDEKEVNDPVYVAYFYIRQDDKELRTVKSLLKTMVWQLQKWDSGFRQHIAHVCEKPFHKTSAADEIWENCFLDYHKSARPSSRTILIIDGLDEAELHERRRLFKILDSFLNTSIPPHNQGLQFAIFGRKTLLGDLKEANLENERHIIKVSPDKTREDLEDFIKDRIHNLKVIKAMKTGMRPAPEVIGKYVQWLQKQVSKGADGVFLWAQIILDQMQNLETKKIEKLLSNPPKTLDDMIVQVLERLCNEDFSAVDIDTMSTILLWVSGSRRPLTFGELEAILRIGGDSTYLLWDHFRGEFASMFNLRFPRNYDPDAPIRQSVQNQSSPGTSNEATNGQLSSDESSDPDRSDCDSDTISVSNEEAEALTEDDFANITNAVTATSNSEEGQLHTIVEFTHSRFLDIIQAKGLLPEAERETLPVLDRIRHTDFWLFCDCIRMMKEGLNQAQFEQRFSLNYPSSNIFLHLEAISLEDIDTEQQSFVFKGLSWLLYMVNQLGYDDPAYLDKSEFQVWFLKAYMSMNSLGEVPDDIANFIWERDSSMTRLSHAEIRALAEWADIEKTTHWYASLGWTLHQAVCLNEAFDCCQKAIDMDASAWVAFEARARCFEYFELYSAAVDEIRKAMQVLPDNMKSVLAYHECYCSIWLKHLGRVAESREMAFSAFDRNPEAPPIIDCMLDNLAELEDLEKLLDILERLDQTYYSHNSTGLTNYILTYGMPDTVGAACRLYGRPKFMVDAGEATLEALELQGNTIRTMKYMLNLATFYYSWYDEDERSLELFEEVYKRYQTADQGIRSACRSFLSKCVMKYAQICFDMAVEHYQSAALGSNKHYSRLKRLATTTNTENSDKPDEMFEYYSADYPALLLGRWLRDYAHSHETKWKQCFRSRILKLLDELDDEDPENDTDACQSLAVTLFQAGDEQSAAQILATLFKPLDEQLIRKRANEQIELCDSSADKLDCKTWEPRDAPLSAYAEAIGIDGAPISRTPNTLPGMDSIILCSTDAISEKTSAMFPDAAEPEIPRKAQEATQEIVHPAKVLELHLRNSWGYSCDLCRRTAGEAESMWFCEICLDINFCTDCLSTVKDGTSKKRICNPKHIWYQAWPIPKGRFEAMAQSQVEGNVVLKKEWLDNLRDNWRLKDGIGTGRIRGAS